MGLVLSKLLVEAENLLDVIRSWTEEELEQEHRQLERRLEELDEQDLITELLQDW
jgi:hypothetical protein